MRALAWGAGGVAVVIVVALAARGLYDPIGSALAADPAAPPPVPRADGFDHVLHEGQVKASGADIPACVTCHPLNDSGAPTRSPGHADCFGACHGELPGRALPRRQSSTGAYPIDDERRVVCLACHEPADLDALAADARRAPAAFYPPFGHNAEFAVQLSHAAHTTAAVDCRACHDVPPDAAASEPPRGRPRRPHARCAQCHTAGTGAKALPITRCEGCHIAAYGRVEGPHSVRGAYPVTDTFSHDKHLRRMAGERPCLVCHAEAATRTSTQIPVPTMQRCEGCHDGGDAFAALTPTCRRCHTQPASEQRLFSAEPKTFSHRTHAALGALDCAACHRLDAAGHALPAAPDHMPCADAACHASEFRDPRPAICTVCHVGAEPWRELHAHRPRRAPTEFGAVYSHAAHLAGAPPRDTRACATCHTGGQTGSEMGVDDGHAACAGGACHAATGGARPFERCAGCHQLDRWPAHARARRERPWSVRARFRHAAHGRLAGDPPCARCHAGIDSASELATIATPQKPLCAGCHDGAAAFKMTGHACARCHGETR